jgi:hydroxymethylglutaryl-CoA reductase
MRMIEAMEWAMDDPFRAVTHNKGIMNGIDAVAVATGQDWRAIEASAHAWAAIGCDGRNDDLSALELSVDADSYSKKSYSPLTQYWVESDDPDWNDGESDEGLWFCGSLMLPISVGTKGGVIKTNPVYEYTLGLMEYPDSKKLAMVSYAF